MPAGLSSNPTKIAAATTAGWSHSTIGTARGTKIHAAVTTSIPVGIRSMIQGAASAPRMPPRPAAVDTRPMTAGETPSCTILRIATKNMAFTSRFASAPYAAVARKYGQPRMKRMPSATSWCGLRGGPSRRGAARSVRRRPSTTQ